MIVELAIALGRQHEGYDPARFVLEAFATTPADLRSTYRAFFEQVLEDTDAVVQVGERNGEVLGYVFGRIEEASFLDLSPRALREARVRRHDARVPLGGGLVALAEGRGPVTHEIDQS